MKRARAESILAAVSAAVFEWPRFADLTIEITRRLAGMRRDIN